MLYMNKRHIAHAAVTILFTWNLFKKKKEKENHFTNLFFMSQVMDGKDLKHRKDRERRKSIIQAVSDFFHKKSPSPSPSKTSEKVPNQSISNKFMKLRLHTLSREKSKVSTFFHSLYPSYLWFSLDTKSLLGIQLQKKTNYHIFKHKWITKSVCIRADYWNWQAKQ